MYAEVSTIEQYNIIYISNIGGVWEVLRRKMSYSAHWREVFLCAKD